MNSTQVVFLHKHLKDQFSQRFRNPTFVPSLQFHKRYKGKENISNGVNKTDYVAHVQAWQFKTAYGGGGGGGGFGGVMYSHVAAYTDVSPKWATFSPKSLNMGPILVKKSLEEGPISLKLTKKKKKRGKISCFSGKTPLEMGPDLRKFRKMSNQPFFKEGKSLFMGRGFRPWLHIPLKTQKIIWVPPQQHPPTILYKTSDIWSEVWRHETNQILSSLCKARMEIKDEKEDEGTASKISFPILDLVVIKIIITRLKTCLCNLNRIFS